MISPFNTIRICSSGNPNGYTITPSYRKKAKEQRTFFQSTTTSMLNHNSHSNTFKQTKRNYQFGYSKPRPFPVDKLVADFRSDTVTRPTEGMLKAIVDAKDIGDNVYDEDLVVRRLEEKIAELCGKEDALFCASGTMSNQLGIRSQLGSLESIICDHRAHIYVHEAGGVAYHCQAQVVPVIPKNDKMKTITAKDIEEWVFDNDVHNAVTKGVALENTLWGQTIPLSNILEIKKLCEEKGLFLHLDGARFANACVKENISARDYAAPFSTLSICLSKSLGCPIGSVLVGTKQICQKAKHYRKLFGGGWRQAGVLAAAGLYALENNWDRLAVDHQNAEFLSNALLKLGFKLTTPTETNLIWISSKDFMIPFDTFAEYCREKGVIIPGGGFDIRLATHLQTSREACELLLRLFEDVLLQHRK